MSASLKAVLRPAQRDGLRPVHLRITAFRTHAYLATGVAVSVKFWNPDATMENARWVRGSHPDADVLNGNIQKLLRAAQQLALDHPGLSAAAIRDLVRPGETVAVPEGPDLLALLGEQVARLDRTGHPRSAGKYESIRHKLQSFVLGIPHPRGRNGLKNETPERQAARAAARLPLAELTVRKMRDYEAWLLALPNRVTTVQKELSFINTVLLRAVEEGQLVEGANPFKKMKLTHGKARPKARLNDAEVARLEALTVEQLTRSQAQGATPAKTFGRLRAREAWLLDFYLLGSRIGDALTLRWRDVGAEAITFTEQKTGKLKVAPRHAQLDALLARLGEAEVTDRTTFVLPYLNAGRWYAQFPGELDWAALSHAKEYRAKWTLLLKKIESATSTINGNLKQVAALAGIDKKLTAHTARHSFADRGRRLGVPASDMRDLLNHHSISQTEEYYGELERSEISTVARTIYAAS